MTELHIHANAANANFTATGRTCTNLALHHLFAACRFSARVREIEFANAGQPFGSFWEEILQNSLGVATLSVAALESYANEMYFEGAVLRRGVNSIASVELANLVDRESILKKYSLALSISVGKKLDFGVTEVQNADALIRLRNAVVHFRPEWFDEQDKHRKLSNILQHKFEPSTFLASEPVFPRAWASHSFTVWALKTTIAFVEHYYLEAGLQSVLLPFRTQLSDLSSVAL
jgi:hypothetical protein